MREWLAPIQHLPNVQLHPKQRADSQFSTLSINHCIVVYTIFKSIVAEFLVDVIDSLSYIAPALQNHILHDSKTPLIVVYPSHSGQIVHHTTNIIYIP